MFQGKLPMLLFRILSPLLFCLFLVSCGLHPLYMKSSGNVCYPLKIEPIKDRRGQILRNYLLDLLTPEGPPSCPRYSLCISLIDEVTSIGVNKDETTSREKAILTAQLTLRDLTTNQIVYNHSTKAINSYNIITNYYSNLVAEEYSKKEATRLLAEKIQLLISAYLDKCEP